MNTQELKQYIDKVLGNNLRCLLPSYWWKRAFGAVIDKVDEKIDGSNLKTINGESIIGTGNLKVGTELRVITLPWQPNVRADENKRYDFTQEFIDAYATAYPDKAETVRSYGEKAFANNKEVFQILIEKAKLNESVDVVIDPVDAYKVFGYEIENYSIDFSASIPTSVSFMNVTSPKELKGCTLMPMPWGGDGGESEFCFMNHEYLYLMEDGSVEYKKYSAGSSGGITVDSELSETSENPVQNKVVTEVLTRFAYNANGMNIYLALGQTSLSAEQRTTNASTFSSLISGIVKPINCVTVTDTVKFQVQLYSWNGSSDRINLYISDWDNGNAFEKLKYRFFPDGSTEYVGRVTVDSELSETSENPIQNKAVTLALNEKASIAYVNEKVGNAGGNITVDTEFSETSENPIANKTVAKALSEVADAFEGKQNTIADLDEIRSGAAKGATAIQEVKTINNQSILGEGNITIQGGGGGVAQLMTNVTYNELVALRDSASLVPGMYYRITDYETETSSANTMSAHHPFDIVVMALSKDTLSEDARAMQSERDIDGYFTNSNLGAWELKYCLDNDINRFSWAVAPSSIIDVDLTDLELGVVSAFLNGTFLYEGVSFYRWDFTFEGMTVCFFTTTENPSVGENTVIYLLEVGEILGEAAIVDTKTTTEKGKGVVYHMVDEKQNDVPYDFKNIMFTRKLTNGQYDDVNGVDEFVYTFNLADESGNLDFSLYGLCNSNVMLPASSTLNNNVFLNHTGDARCMSNKFGTYCLNNTFGNFALFNTFGDYCSNNLFGEDCGENSFGNDCYDNIFGNSFNGNKMDGGYGNVFGDTCWGNIIGTSFNDNRLGDNCSGNEFGSENNGNILSHGCDYNKFGYYCRENELGENCSGNTFNNRCARNILGNYCSFNDFGNYCQSHVFGNYCQQISLGDDCFGIIIGVQGVDSYYKRIKIKNGYHIKLVNTESAVSQSQVQNYTIGEISGENQSNKIQLEVFRGRIGETYISKNSNGEIKQWCPADLAQ